ncbi:Hypothetical_protein [Hexamita inflata]|uniref:Hypothetical_protein n=1 Tax=Hexamita inflata TaxID=28002 RepID=A0AA86R2T3_9EUKA|nr:Hypothetical protein HINF_LOCUS57020 [Hexamita inflata]
MKWKWKIISKITVVQSSINILFNAGPDQPMIPFFKKQKCIHYLNIENESDCNYLNYNSNQAKYQYFILSSRLRLKEKVHCFCDQEIPKIVQINQLKMNTEVLCRSSACATSYKLYCVRIPIIGSSYSFLQSGLTTIYFEIKSFINQFC